MQFKEAMQLLQSEFGEERGSLAYQIVILSFSGLPCDVTFFRRKPSLNVSISRQLSLDLIHGTEKLRITFGSISLSDGSLVSFDEIWAILPLPLEGFTERQLAEVDLSQGEQKVGPHGESARTMIREMYHCNSKEEEDEFLRRYLAY